MTFSGTPEQLRELVGQLGIPAHWEHKGPYELCVFDDGVSNFKLNWWPGTGELRLVGDPEVREMVQRQLEAQLAG